MEERGSKSERTINNPLLDEVILWILLLLYMHVLFIGDKKKMLCCTLHALTINPSEIAISSV